MARFRFGICDWSVKEKGNGLFSLVARMGFDGLQLSLGDDVLKKDNEFYRMLDTNEHGLKKYGLQCPSIALEAFQQINIANHSDRDLAESLVKKAILFAHTVGAEQLVFPLFDASELNNQRKLEMTGDFIRRLIPAMESARLNISVEGNLKEKQCFDLLAVVGEERFGILFDSQNNYLAYKENMAKLFRKLMPHVNCIHVKDGKHGVLSGSLLGQGDSGFYDTAKAIVDSEYSGWIFTENYYYKAPLKEEKSIEKLIAEDLLTMKNEFSA